MDLVRPMVEALEDVTVVLLLILLQPSKMLEVSTLGAAGVNA